GGGGKDNIGFWTNPADTASWTFNVSQPGVFNVSAEIAAEKSGKFELIVADQKLSGVAPATQDYTKFKRANLPGKLELPAGNVTLKVQPLAEGWQPMNLRALKLQPAN
ncbi:MAG: hypothetical protein ACTHLW_14935, partial [Verrucomicrobiota bacterium]